MERVSIIAGMIKRRIYSDFPTLLDYSSAAALLAPRQLGKTTLPVDVGKTLATFSIV